MWMRSDSGRMCRYLAVVSSHRAYHVTGMGVIPLIPALASRPENLPLGLVMHSSYVSSIPLVRMIHFALLRYINNHGEVWQTSHCQLDCSH